MIKVTLRGILEHKVRFLLSIIAVILGVAFVAGTFSLRTMLSSTFESITATTMQGDIYVRQPTNVTGSQAEAPAIPVALAEELAKLDEVESALPSISGSIVLVGKDGTAVSSTQAPVMAIISHEGDKSSTLRNGRAPADASEIALETITLERSGLKIGDKTKVIMLGEIVEVTVVGERFFEGPLAGATIVFVDEATGLAAFAPEGLVTAIEIYLPKGQDVEAARTKIKAAVDAFGLDSNVSTETGAESREIANESISEMIGFIGTFLLIFAAISLFVGAFIISNTFAMTVAARARELALLRAIGASRLQIFGSVVGQAAVIGVLGSIIGVGAGLGLVYAIKGVFESMGMALSGDIPLETSTIIVAVLCGLVVSVGAAAVPARRAARTAPVEAMREGAAVSAKSSLMRAIIGVTLTAIGIGLVLYAVSQGTDDMMPVYGGGAAATLVGILIAAPTLAPAMTFVLAWPFAAAIRPMGKLARGNVSRSPKRTAATASALIIGMALVGAASVVAASASSSLASALADESDYDFTIMGAGGMGTIPEGAVLAVKESDLIESVDTMEMVMRSVDGEDIPLVAIEPSALGRTMKPVLESGKLSLNDTTVMAQSGYASDNKIKVGDALKVGANGDAITVKVGGIIDSKMIGGSVAISQDLLAEISQPAERMLLNGLITKADGASDAEARKAITDAVAPYIVVSVYSDEEFTSVVTERVNQMLSLLYALLGLSIVIAILGIVNTLTLSVMERTREIGLLRAVGLGRLQLATTITVESVLISIFGAVLGLLVGVGLGAALPSIMADSGLKTLTIPWGELVVMVGLAIIVGILAAIWPAIRASRLPVLEAIAAE